MDYRAGISVNLCSFVPCSSLHEDRGRLRILASTVTLNNLTTQELLKRVEDMMREDWEFLKDFNAAVDQLQKKQEKFQTEHPAFGRYS